MAGWLTDSHMLQGQFCTESCTTADKMVQFISIIASINVKCLVQGRCSRDNCRYYHPPPHIGEKLLASTSSSRGPPPQQPRGAQPPRGPRGRSPPPSMPLDRVHLPLFRFVTVYGTQKRVPSGHKCYSIAVVGVKILKF